MPSDEYAPTVRGGLKLKGSKPTGVEKKKKKKKAAPSTSEPVPESSSSKELSTSTKDKEAVEEELSEDKLRELEERGGDGKTDSERAYEEMRRKRVRSLPFIPVED
jgi:protein FAM32A